MRKTTNRLIAVLLVLASLLSLSACGGSAPEAEPEKNIDADALMSSLLGGVNFASSLVNIGEGAEVFFPGLPEGATAVMYMGDAKYADELSMITVTDAGQTEAAVETVREYVKQKRDQFLHYIPEEVAKIDKAIVWTNGVHIILCITDDVDNAQYLMDNAYEVGKVPPTEAPPTDPPPVVPTDPPVPVVGSIYATGKLNAKGYPELKSTSGSYYYHNDIIMVDNMAFEAYNYVDSAATRYANLVSSVADQLAGQVTVYDMVIPTAIGIVMPDNVNISTPDQMQSSEKIFAKMSDNVVKVQCVDNLLKRRDEYLYFRSDWHWNGIGAYYGYEAFCEAKGIIPYTKSQRAESQFGGYLGGLYTNFGNPENLKDTPDTVYAYHPYSPSAYMYYTETNGGEKVYWNIIMDVSGWAYYSRYNAFCAGDQPFAELTNPAVTDGSVLIVVKESFGNALMSYVVDHYSTVYEIDYRHWNDPSGRNLVQFAKDVGATDILFANNIGMIRSDYLIGMLDRII